MCNNKSVCKICGVEFEGKYCSTRMINHIKGTHGLSSKQYYIAYCKSETEGSCLICGNPTQYIKFSQGFNVYCSKQCHFKDKERINLEIKKTCYERYGVDSPIKNQDIQSKIKLTLIEKYGVDNPMKCKGMVNAAKDTCLRKYGRVSYTGTQKWKQSYKRTCLQRYGEQCHQRSKEVKLKVAKTNQERYGGSCPYNSKEVVQKGLKTQRERNGGNGFQSTVILEKFIQSTIKKYGNNSPYKYFLHQRGNIYYRSKIQKELIQFCLSNNISIKNGPNIPYTINGKLHKYFVDFLITYENGNKRLIETKGNHPWYQQQLKNGVFKEKVKCAIQYSNCNGYLPYKVLFNKKEFQSVL